MEIFDHLTEQRLLEILEESILKGQEDEYIQINDFIEELKQKVLAVVGKED